VNLGDAHKAIEFFEQALSIARKIGDRSSEGNHLNNMGSTYKYLGDIQKAVECQKEALRIAQEIGDRQGEGSRLSNLGNRYSELADFKRALDFYEKSIVIEREIGDRRSESIGLENIGYAFLNLEEYQKGKESYQQAIQIADEISFPQTQNAARWGLAQSCLFQNDLVNARAAIEAALQYDVPDNNHNVSALHGIIALRQGDEVAARGAFVRAIGQADEILSKTAEFYSALDAKGLAICGLILAGRGDPSMQTGANDGKTVPPDKSTVSDWRVAPTVDDAIETFRKAREIAPHAGVVKSVLRLFDELVKCEGGEILKDVRKAVEGVE
jgi:tetratricopeptide (TPR) repeat protein